MTILTIVIVVLCTLTIFPAFAIPGTVKNWNPAVLQYDLGTDLNGGYYAYYLPKGVITETEYKDSVAAYEAAVEEAEAEFAAGKLKQKDLDKIKDECEEYKSLYVTVDGVNGLYFSTADDANDDSYIVDDNGVYRYEIFAAYEAGIKTYTYCIGFTEERKAAFLESCLERSVINTGITPTGKDRILTLSTCTGTGYDTRWVVQARLAAAE